MKSNIMPRLDPKVMNCRTTTVYAKTKRYGDKLVLAHCFSSGIWVLAGTMVEVDVMEWWYDKPKESVMIELYGGASHIPITKEAEE